ncbi:hypothetical protein B0I35DRAFT_98482 [Stachybotrys elegans]|uniref:Uncharacterized protein n=1 Tax=Stachybotrys elegans TaxID=80388 RepID=A0A8K0SKY0_9HYPO|nr:hypothetical protein B0I35DRAFT_98482 [Stachybotrys elegans]
MKSHDASIRMEESTARMEKMTGTMQKIARLTERDTASMHVITFFALVFLPGTFLGSFFSTPIFEGVTSSLGGGWTFNRQLFILFSEICFPLMIIMLMSWWLYMLITRRQRRTLLEEDAIC